MALKLVPIQSELIRIGEPLPFSLFDANGTLLASRGFEFKLRSELEVLRARGGTLFIDAVESGVHNRAFVGMLHDMVRKDANLGEIASRRITAFDADPEKTDIEESDGPADWLDYQAQATVLLRDPQNPLFLGRLEQLNRRLQRQARDNPDATLFALFYLSASEIKMYSATHAMLVSVMCGLAAREVLTWSAEEERIACMAALTMNVSMTELQDRLAQQTGDLTTEQRGIVNLHAQRSVEILQAIGVKDEAWLEAVMHHHSVQAGPLAPRSPGMRMARLIQRADVFGARLAPRATRAPTMPTAAMKASYFDENQAVDQAGAALIKAVGVYSPGSLVKLLTDEVAIVVRRGGNSTTPKVAVLVNREGLPLIDPIVRDTALKDYRIVSSVPQRDVKVKINLQRMLALSASTSA
jgi:HD-GYP domain-containing protein (c-di-GMP phosphodiesterase class II)